MPVLLEGKINRRIGGLEMIHILIATPSAINRRIGGLETTLEHAS